MAVAMVDSLTLFIAVNLVLALFLFIPLRLKNRRLLFLLLACYMLHLILMGIMQFDLSKPMFPPASQFFNDGEGFAEHAHIISSILIKRPFGYISELSAGSEWVLEWTRRGMIPPARTYQVGYITYFYGILYSIIGNHPFILNLWNIFLHLLSGMLIYKIAIALFDRKTAFLSTLLFLFNPTMFYYSTTKVGESSYIFLICLILYLCLRINVRYFSIVNLVKKALLTTGSIFSSLFKGRPLGQLLMPTLRFLISIAIIIIALFSFSLLKPRFMPLIVMAIFLYVIAVTFMRFSRKFKIAVSSAVFLCIPLALPKMLIFFNTLFNTVAYTHKMYLESGGQVYSLLRFGTDYVNYTLWQKIAYFFFGWLHLIIEPTEYGSMTYIAYYPFKIIFILLFISAIMGMFFSIKEGKLPALLLTFYMFIMGTVIATASGNSGTMLRHRDAISFVIFIFAASYIVRLIDRFNAGRLIDDIRRLRNRGKNDHKN